MSRELPARPRGRLGQLLGRFLAHRINGVALLFLGLVCVCALAADLIASDQPIACRVHGKLYVLPALFMPAALRGQDNQSLAQLVQREGGFVLAPLVPYGPNQIEVSGQITWLAAPSAAHLLGTDDNGRDVLARVVYGVRTALAVGTGSVLTYLVLAVLLGALAGYFGGSMDRLLLRLIETFSSFPTLFLILAIQGLMGVTTTAQLVLVIGLTRWPEVARITRAEVLRVSHEDYVQAARALGLSHLRILARHVLPSAMGPVWVTASFGVAGAILIESTLSFLGFGVPPTTPSFGQLLADAFHNKGCYWLGVFPGAILLATLVAINLVGEGLRDAFDADA